MKSGLYINFVQSNKPPLYKCRQYYGFFYQDLMTSDSPSKLLNFLNGLVHLPFLDLSIINFRDIKLKNWCWSPNSIELGKTAWMCRLAWLYNTAGKG